MPQNVARVSALPRIDAHLTCDDEVDALFGPTCNAKCPSSLCPSTPCAVPVTVQAGVRVGVPVSVRVQKKAAPFGQGYQLRFIDVLIVISACGSVADAADAAAACWFLSAWCLLWLPLHVVCRLYIPYRA